MLRRLIILFVVLGLLGGGAYLFLFKSKETLRFTKGYKEAKTPQIAADMFSKAIKERDYESAADYATKDYAEQLKRGHKAANKMGVQLDNMMFQMEKRDFLRDESKYVLFQLDPFYKDFTVVVSKESGDKAEGLLTFNLPFLKGGQPSAGSWQLKPEMFQAFIAHMGFSSGNAVAVPMVKDKEGWKFDFPSNTLLQTRVAYLNDKYMHYFNVYEMLDQDVKNDPTTRENTTSRLKTELEKAAKE